MADKIVFANYVQERIWNEDVLASVQCRLSEKFVFIVLVPHREHLSSYDFYLHSSLLQGLIC
jgi:hypothetical protein